MPTLTENALDQAQKCLDTALAAFVAEFQKEVGLKQKVRDEVKKLNDYTEKVKTTFKTLEDKAKELHELQRGPFLKLVQDAAKEFEAVDKVADGLVAAVKPPEQL